MVALVLPGQSGHGGRPGHQCRPGRLVPQRQTALADGRGGLGRLPSRDPRRRRPGRRTKGRLPGAHAVGHPRRHGTALRQPAALGRQRAGRADRVRSPHGRRSPRAARRSTYQLPAHLTSVIRRMPRRRGSWAMSTPAKPPNAAPDERPECLRLQAGTGGFPWEHPSSTIARPLQYRPELADLRSTPTRRWGTKWREDTELAASPVVAECAGCTDDDAR
jgi:hypothetical protein